MTLSLLILAGCGGDPLADLGQVHYRFLDSALASGWAGSCLPTLSGIAYAQYYDSPFRDLNWAAGADLDVEVTWPDRRDCGATSQGYWICPPVNVEFAPLGFRVWDIVYTTEKPSPSFIVGLRAHSEGEGGFKTLVHGKAFDPPFKLKVGKASAIQFEQSRSSQYDALVPGAITEIHIPRNTEVIAAGTLRDSAGAHVCGALPATSTIEPPGIFFVKTIQGPYINLPYRIYGNTPGRGTFEVTVGDLKGSLTVIVN
jgi:hypothetical protein